MGRQHQTRRCGRRRSRDGQPCRRWAIVGGTVCASHGGRAPQVRAAARTRVAFRQLELAVEHSSARYEERLVEWQAERVAVTAELMGVEPEDVTPALIGFCVGLHGRPAPASEAPAFRLDGRFGPILKAKTRSA